MKLPPRIQKQMYEHNRRKREGMSGSHLDDIRKLPCLSCGRDPGGEANHLMHPDHGPNGRGLNRKQADQWAVPIDRKCHAAVTDVGDDDAWYARRGIDARSTAAALWAARGNFELMQKIVFAVRQRAALKLRQASGG